MIQRNEQSRAESSDTVRAETSQEEKLCLRYHLEVDNDVHEVTLDHRLFRTRKAATGNVWSPVVEWRISGTINVDVDADLRCC